jgi:hypothetical protein
MKPPGTDLPKDLFPIDVTRLHLTRSCVATIRVANGTANTMAALCEIEPVAYSSSHAIIITPHKEICTDATLQDAIFNEMANLVIDKRRDDGRTKTKAFPETSGNVVFSTAFPCLKLSCRSYAPLSRVETQHYLT